MFRGTANEHQWKPPRIIEAESAGGTRTPPARQPAGLRMALGASLSVSLAAEPPVVSLGSSVYGITKLYWDKRCLKPCASPW